MRRRTLFLVTLCGVAMTMTACDPSPTEGSNSTVSPEFTTTQQSLVKRGPRGKRGARGPRGLRGLRGPAGAPGSAGAPVYPVAPGVSAVMINRSYFHTGKDVNGFLMLRLYDQSASVGTFYGSGQGNKAMLGLTSYDREPVSDFESLSFRAKIPASSALNRGVYANFVVDLECDPLDPQYAIIVVEGPLSVGAQGEWHAYGFAADEPVFRSVGGRGGLPSHVSQAGGVLGLLTGAHPDACFVNADPFDNGMPKHTKLPSMLLVLGDSGTTTSSHIYLDDVSVRMDGQLDTYAFD